MLKLSSFLILFLCFISCTSDKRNNFTSLDDDGNIILTETSKKILAEIQEDYYSCYEEKKSTSAECIHFTSEALCRFYQIKDFVEGKKYKSYKVIRDQVAIAKKGWHEVGAASSQEALNKAQDLANSGRAVVALDPNKNYHVAIILPGNLTTSRSWDLKCPNSASYFRHKVKAYFNKALSYSYSSPDGIKIFARDE